MKDIKYLVLDVDGTLTDGKIYMGLNGETMKAFNIKDGYGIHNILPSNAIIPVIITGRNSQIVTNRCNELGIEHIFQGVTNKLETLISIIGDESELKNVAYMGDDLNDMACMEKVKKYGGLVGCPSDAVQKVKDTADYVSPNMGGCGAVRDFIEWIIQC